MRKTDLTNDTRQRMVKEIINHMVATLGLNGYYYSNKELVKIVELINKIHFRIKSYMLECIADEICTIFPNKIKKTYMIP